MPSPFPGMDPYLEHPSLWPDVHNKLISELQTAINPKLPANYVARMEARVYVSDESDPGRQSIVPYLRIERVPVSTAGKAAKIAAGFEAAEPLEYPMPFEEEIAEVYLTIQERTSDSLVAIVELLSYSNKIVGSTGRKSFLEKKREVLASPVHWVEVDLLRKGERLPNGPPIVASDYRVTIWRGNARKKARYWPIQLQQKLPSVGIPLRGKHDDVVVDLGEVLNTAYDRAMYNRSINYRVRPIPQLRPADAKWANQLLKSKGLR